MKMTNVCTNCQIVCGAGKADRAYVIFSYGTPVLAIDCSGMKPRLVRLWDGWSATTQHHINKALDMMPGGNRYGKMSKATWESMAVENVYS